MKNCLLIFSFLSLSLHAQVPVYIDCMGTDLPLNTITFEDTAYWNRIGIDTANFPGNSWQIGRPSKSFCPAAHSGASCLITDTTADYTAGAYSVAEMMLDIHTGGSWWIFLTGQMKYETDSMRDGGTIEYSEDGRATWRNAAESSAFSWGQPPYSVNDTVAALGAPGVSGSSGGWVYFSIYLEPISPTNTPDTFYVRFVFAGDSIPDSLGGWALDDIFLFGACSGIEEQEQAQFRLFPNPSAGIVHVENTNAQLPPVIEIYDCLGRFVSRQANVETMDLSALPNGVYFLNIRTGNRQERHRLIISHD